ncbi:MAG TPA: ABC transporter permease [Bryobacteraceae bacterium]|jgi:predicted permease
MISRRWRDILRLRFRSLLRRAAVERELEKELRFHLEQAAEEARVKGFPEEEASHAARKRLGGMAQIEEECRAMRRTNFIETLGQDLRYAARMLAKSPGFTLTILSTLALSIGATTAIVSVVDGVLLRPLPYREPDQLVRVFTSNRAFPKFPINPNDFLDFRARLRSFESIAAYTRRDVQLSGVGEPVQLSGFAVTDGFFHLLGIKPELGREFNRADELPGKGNIAIVSHNVWRTLLGGRRDIVGRKIVLSNIPYTVVGVMPPGVKHPGNMYHAVGYGDTVDIWRPFTFSSPKDRGSHYLEGIARLRPGVSARQAQGEMNAAMAELRREHPGGDSGWNVRLVPLEKEIVGHSERLLWVLLGIVSLVLLLACVNAANLLLARATVRERELAVRAAVGAARARLLRQMLTESILLAFVGAVCGAALAVAGVKALVALMPADFPRSGDIHLDIPIFLFALAIALATGIIFGIVPALEGSRTDLRESLHESGRSATGSRNALRLRSGLVVGEVALACVLLIGAGLMLRSFVKLLRADPGFRPDRVLTAAVSLPEVTYKDNNAVRVFHLRLLDKLRAIPGVVNAGAGSDLPWSGWDDNWGGFDIQGEAPPPNEFFHARYHEATPGYFRALGIPLVRGRAFEDGDKADSRAVLMINEAMAKYWRHGDALGGKVSFNHKDWLTIVGIVGNVKDNPKNPGAEPSFWWPLTQEPFPLGANSQIVIRSNLDTKLIAARLRAVVTELDANLAVSDIRTMEAVADGSYSTSRFALVLVAAFASHAVVLAAIGTYGVIAYSVNQRIHEFGIRMALGARPRDLIADVVANGVALAILGVLLGLALGLALTRLLSGLLYGVSPSDPLSMAGASGLAIAVTALACCVPAIRATRADPMGALRAD